MDISNINALRVLTWIAAFVGLTMWSYTIWRYPKWKYLGGAVISYFLHLTAFYSALIFLQFDPVFLNTWSIAIRIHGIMLLCAGAHMIWKT